MKNKIRIGITTGDPKGVGPEIVQSALTYFAKEEQSNLIELQTFGELQHLKNLSDWEAGSIAAASIRESVKAAMSNRIDAIVTAPINKKRLSAAGISYPGHTELLAHYASEKNPPATRMIFISPRMRVALNTLHIPLHLVSSLLTSERLRETALITHKFLQEYCALKNPHIACLGLNPHAGEDGLLGCEEIDTINPTLKVLNEAGMNFSGPFPADSFFSHAINCDAVIAQYHDQGLIPIKSLDFDNAVNVTMGLPFLRTSVSHGTADDIAGSGKASAKSLICAIKLAIELMQNKNL